MTPGTAKRKGAETEQLACGWLYQVGFDHAERRHLAGQHDRGDIAGVPGWTIEVKSGARLDLPGWMAELHCEMDNTGDPHGLLMIRPKGRPNPKHWWYVIDSETAATMLRQVTP